MIVARNDQIVTKLAMIIDSWRGRHAAGEHPCAGRADLATMSENGSGEAEGGEA
jgi:hypothetical protein